MTDDILAAGRAFIEREGRLVERRLAETIFDGADPAGVIDAVRAFRNGDGGFGHGFEPDKRCPASLPIDVECALDALLAAGAGLDRTEGMVLDACGWLATVAEPGGAVPLAFPVIERHPRAEHWTDWTYAAGLNPTAGLAGRLHQLGAEHPWLDKATEWTWAALESGFDDDAHALGEVLIFLAHAPGGDPASFDDRVKDWMVGAKWFQADPEAGYGVTPLHYAPSPQSRWRRLFDDKVIDGHLDRMAARRQPDGGWPITWDPPSAASALEWRGIETLRALRTLHAYGRIG
jgi:hypothetical protein